MIVYKIGWWLKYRRPRWLGSIINKLYYNEEICMVQTKEVDFVSMDGCRFYPSDLTDSLVHPKHMELWFSNIGKEDIVLDIGAGIGSVCIPLAKKCRKVYAVEPLFNMELSRNMTLNGLDNLEVIKAAIGIRGDRTLVQFGSKKESVITYTFDELYNKLQEKPTFLKCDCEGEEWYINKEYFLKFKELRIEWHIRYEKEVEEVKSITKFLLKNNYRCIIWNGEHEPSPIFKKVLYMVASRKS